MPNLKIRFKSKIRRPFLATRFALRKASVKFLRRIFFRKVNRLLCISLDTERIADGTGAQIQRLLSVKLIGVIPDDEQVIVSTNKGEPLVLSDKPSLAGTAYTNVAKRLEGKEVEFLKLEAPPKGIFARLSSWISGNS